MTVVFNGACFFLGDFHEVQEGFFPSRGWLCVFQVCFLSHLRLHLSDLPVFFFPSQD